jgi:hypothetical protein
MISLCLVSLFAALLVCATAPAAAGDAPSPDIAKIIQREQMIFFVARGEPDACGAGCSEWVAAEGRIDFDAPRRFAWSKRSAIEWPLGLSPMSPRWALTRLSSMRRFVSLMKNYIA